MLGAGAIGSLYAAKLSACSDVLLIGRAAHVTAIESAGLRVVGREERICRMRAAARVTAIAPRTLILLTTKVNDNRAAAESIASLVQPDTVVLCVQNGLGGDAIVKSVVGDTCRVLRGVTQFGAIFAAPGVVDFKAAGYTLVEESPVSGPVANVLTAAGLDGRICATIAVEVWRKLIFNCVINPITAICGTDVGSIADARLDPLKRLVIDECLRVANADGIAFDDERSSTIDAWLQTIAEVFGPSRNIASTRQDLLKGRPTEIDFMNGAVVERGRRHAIECPVNAALIAIIKAMEASSRAQRSDG